jgi:hypothetical protein
MFEHLINDLLGEVLLLAGLALLLAGAAGFLLGRWTK